MVLIVMIVMMIVLVITDITTIAITDEDFVALSGLFEAAAHLQPHENRLRRI